MLLILFFKFLYKNILEKLPIELHIFMKCFLLFKFLSEHILQNFKLLWHFFTNQRVRIQL